MADTSFYHHMAEQSLGTCRHFSHVSIKHDLFLLCRIVCATSLSARLFTWVTGVVSLPSDGSQRWQQCPDRSVSRRTVKIMGPFFLCHSQVNAAKVVRCDDNSKNVIVVRADTLYCQPFSNGCQPFRFIVGPPYGRADNEPGGLTTIAVQLLNKY